MEEVCPKVQCTGCSACMNSCRHKAIKMVNDKFGFLYPEIDESKCVDCKLCQIVCPTLNDVSKQIPISGYVCHAASVEEQKSSTSGGAISVIARYILGNSDGVVYGCTNIPDFETKHIRITKTDDLYLLKGSKYVQSKLEKIFSLVKQDLLNDRLVLFTGTPCQVAGLKSFLRKDYSNLYTIDFVCHGVPSQSFLNESIEEVSSKKNISNTVLEFRYKYIPKIYNILPDFLKSQIKMKSIYGLHFIDENNHLVYSEKYPFNDYILGFLTGLTYRESCYKCKYATPDRCSEFTCGDYYDSKIVSKLPGSKRLASMISVNNKKAELLFMRFKGDLIYTSVDYQKILESHRQLREPMQRHPKRDEFLSAYTPKGFIAAMHDVMEYEKKRIVRNRKLDLISNLVYKISFIRKLRGK